MSDKKKTHPTMPRKLQGECNLCRMNLTVKRKGHKDVASMDQALQDILLSHVKERHYTEYCQVGEEMAVAQRMCEEKNKAALRDALVRV